jgi:hypothetical protein
MTRLIHGPKVFGMSLMVAIGLMMVMAAAAQAGEFRLNGQTFANLGLAQETFSGESGAGKLLVPGLSLTIECTSGDVTGIAFRGGTVLANVLFLGCKVAGNLFCKVYPTEADRNAKIGAGDITAVGKGPLLLMGGKHYLLAEEDGQAFTLIWFSKASEGCTLNSGECVTGSTALEIEDALVNQQLHSARPLTQAEIEALYPADLLSYGNQRAWLDGGLTTVHLSGANANANWSAE